MQKRGVQAAAEEGAADGERRSQLRKSTIKGAKIVYRNGHCVLDCVLKNISKTGARIEVDTLIELPATFWIHFGDGTPKREVELVWRKGRMLGVRFMDSSGLNASERTDGSAKYAILDRITLIEKQLTEMRRELMVLLRD